MRVWNRVVLSTVAAVALASPALAEDFKIGYSVFWGTNPFLVTMVNGAKKAAEEWKAKGVNVDLIVTNGGDTDKAKQVADLEDLYAQGVDGLLIFPGDSILVAEPIKNVYNAEKIPVVITDIGVRSGEYISLIITDNLKGGAQAADYMATLVPKGGKVITFDFAPTNDNGQTRQKGFEDRAKELGLDGASRAAAAGAVARRRTPGDGGPARLRAGHQGRVLVQPAGHPGRLPGPRAAGQDQRRPAGRLRPRSGVLQDGRRRQDRRAGRPGPLPHGL